MTPEEIAARRGRAIEAAVAAGRRLGLDVAEPAVLHDGFSVVVHLAPAPVVVRVPVVLPIGFGIEAQRARQQREIDLVGWLGDQAFAVVRPSPLVPRAPVVADGFSMSFWEHVAVAPAAPDFVAGSAEVAALHEAMRRYPAPLPFLSPVTITVPSCLSFLREHPALIGDEGLAKMEDEWRRVEPIVASREAFERRFPGASLQPIHGDAPAYNLIHTTSGIRHADFEDVTLGPPEWDLAGFGDEAYRAYDAAAAKVGRRALDAGVLRVMEAARTLQLVSCLALVPQFPALAAGIGPMIDAWRATPLVLP